jgi:hypothetical protein
MEFQRRAARHRPVVQREAEYSRRKSELARIKARREEERFRYLHLR